MCSEPRELWCYDDAFKMKQKWKDEEAWNQGMYFLEVIMCTIGNIGNKDEPIEYPKRPLSYKTISERASNSSEEIAVYEMKQRIKLMEKSGLKQSPL